ncbi:PREDICTED: BAG family molecular chaperone regulator 7 [Tarenaya hassleriana]|uniref:BAG family molecular chaperone regulator 7 n=1 Tax=Tarenaya hassleriana TaxID=28532 RepID=UPI00053C2BC3|nr:PREDICTED: BAG family molecular chaperone regulator 7 [Tarenaya hassleriana]
MSWPRRIDVFQPFYSSPLLFRETPFEEPPFLGFPSLVEVDDLGLCLDFANPSPHDLFDDVADLVRVDKTPARCTYQRISRRLEPELPLHYLCDRVSALECKFDRLVSPGISDCDRKYKLTKEIKGSGERKYKWEAEFDGPSERKYKWEADLGGAASERKYRWEAEINGPPERKYKWEADLGGAASERKYRWEAEIEGPAERKYKWTAEVKGGKKDTEREFVVVRKTKAAAAEKKKRDYKWTAEIKSVKASNGGDAENSGKEKKEKKSKKKEKTRVVVIEEEDEQDNHGAVVLRKAFAKRTGAVRSKKGKKKELAPEEAALMIQRAFRAYLIRRSKALRALRELAVAKTKLKEIRADFHNFNYRRLIGRDAEERQKFSERIIVLLLTVDAIEGVDVMVRGAKRSMIEELEAMLEVVDPQQPAGNLGSLKRRTFDMPDSLIRKEIAEGVTQIVNMLETDE